MIASSSFLLLASWLLCVLTPGSFGFTSTTIAATSTFLKRSSSISSINSSTQQQHQQQQHHQQQYHISTALAAAQRLTDLPKGINPFEKADLKSLNLENDFRSKATLALQQARKDGKRCLEIEFPPLLFKGKTQFDDFDNVQELDLNRDWCVEWLPALNSGKTSPVVWLALPDLKECELAKKEWRGGRYRNAAKFTTIEAATRHYTKNSEYKKPWGATIAGGVSELFAGGGLLGDSTTLDELEGSADIHVICQPGNGGPVEDWVNCEILHNNSGGSAATVIVNGALDKVRDGYYPGIFFPALAATVDRFYRPFESILYLRPISDKGAYGWLFRVYPEPWQVVLQTAATTTTTTQGKNSSKVTVTNTVVYTSETRPKYAVALQELLKASQQQQQQRV